MAIILTSKGEEILVDDSDFERINQHKWYIRGGYAVRWLYVKPKTFSYLMHRDVLGLGNKLEDDLIVDHINHMRLDNRKENLRIVTPSQNSWNQSKTSKNTSGFIGVSYCKNKSVNPWKSQIRVNKERLFLGYFATPEEASQAYQSAKAKLHLF